MKETFQSSPNMDMELEIQNSLEERRDELQGLASEFGITGAEATESTEKLIEKKYPPTNFGGIKLNKTATYNVSGVTERLKRTGRRCATNPTYENSLVMTQNGEKKYITHTETYYTDKDIFSNGKPKFPVENIERRIRKILNEDRKRLGLNDIPKNQKVRYYGEDGTIRDMNGYIIVAADLTHFPRGTLIMTTLGPGRVYDVGGKVHKNHIDVFTGWPV